MDIDWATRIITVFKTDSFMTALGGSSYNIDTNAFKLAVQDRLDDVDGQAFPDAFSHNTSVLLGGIEYARTIEFINGYTITFDDTGGAWICNLTGSNNNILDVTNLTSVQVRSNNSAGLQGLSTILASAYDSQVCVDVINGRSGTSTPIGTRSAPVNNFADALIIAQNNSIRVIQVMESATLAAVNYGAGYTFRGDSAVTVTLTIDPSAQVENCSFENMTVTGTMDGENTFRSCNILDISYANGFIFECALNGTITLAGGAQCSLFNCWSNIAGAGAYPIIDMGGSGNSLAVRNYSGGIGVNNYSGGGAVSLDMASGRVIVGSTVTAGSLTIRGIADLEDNSTGTAVVVDATVNQSLDIMLTLLGAVSTVVTFIRKLLSNKVTVAPNDSTTTIYDDDKVAVIHQFTHTDARNRDPV